MIRSRNSLPGAGRAGQSTERLLCDSGGGAANLATGKDACHDAIHMGKKVDATDGAFTGEQRA